MVCSLWIFRLEFFGPRSLSLSLGEGARRILRPACRDRISLNNPPIRGLFGENREISVRPRVRGGLGRTQTHGNNQILSAKVRQLSAYEVQRGIFKRVAPPSPVHPPRHEVAFAERRLVPTRFNHHPSRMHGLMRNKRSKHYYRPAPSVVAARARSRAAAETSVSGIRNAKAPSKTTAILRSTCAN